jgi:Spy/CpxP family protein refolding chaperone
MISRHALAAITVAAVLGATAVPAAAQQPPAAGATKAPADAPAKGTPRQSQLPGDELFTPEERRAFFDRMKAAQTPEERAKIQAERRATAEARAKEKGITLPPTPGPAPGAPKAQ